MAAGIYKKFVELLPYPLRLIENPTRTQDVMGPYHELLSEGSCEGFTPVILTLTEALLEAMRMNLADWAGCSKNRQTPAPLPPTHSSWLRSTVRRCGAPPRRI